MLCVRRQINDYYYYYYYVLEYVRQTLHMHRQLFMHGYSLDSDINKGLTTGGAYFVVSDSD